MRARPERRTDGLVTERIRGEIVVLDVDANRAHALDVDAAAVWTACDGRRDLAELSSATGLSDAAIQASLAELSDAGLLTGVPAGISRRRLLQVGGTVAAGAAVLSIAMPAAEAAASVIDCTTAAPLTKDTLVSLRPPTLDGYLTHVSGDPAAPGKDTPQQTYVVTESDVLFANQRNATFKVVDGLSDPSAVSFQSIDYPTCYLRLLSAAGNSLSLSGRNGLFYGQGGRGGTPFDQDATFQPISCGAGIAFQSVSTPTYYMYRRPRSSSGRNLVYFTSFGGALTPASSEAQWIVVPGLVSA